MRASSFSDFSSRTGRAFVYFVQKSLDGSIHILFAVAVEKVTIKLVYVFLGPESFIALSSSFRLFFQSKKQNFRLSNK